jgi:hypothetical protein
MPKAATFLHWYDTRRLRAEGRSLSQISRALDLSMRQIKDLLRGFEASNEVLTDRTPASVARCGVCGRRHGRPTARSDLRQRDLFGVR